MSKIYINMSINGYVSVTALATMMAAMSGEGVELSPYPTDDGAKGSPEKDAASASLAVATTDKVSTAAASPVAAAAAATDAPTGETDAAGTVFDPSRHTGTKVKSGLWRMKTGMSRGANEGEDSPTYVNPNGSGTGTTTATAGSAPVASAQPTAAAVDDDDEFAAFTTAANAGAPVAATARTWSDADLSKLNNQAAQKLGSAEPVKATIAKFVPAGETPHSRNIPADQREAFAAEIEKVAGIEYAG